MSKIAIWHHDDADGFGAAYAACKFFLQQDDVCNEVVLTPVNYGKPLPELPCDTELLYILDFSYDIKTLLELRDKVTFMGVIDHHKTAEETLKYIPGNSIFDTRKSGAILAWECFFKGVAPPVILQYVQDRDLWKFELPYSKEVNLYISTLDNTLEAWDSFDIETAIAAGKTIASFQEGLLKNYIKNTSFIKYEGYDIPVVNAVNLISEVGNRLCLEFKVPFSISYCDRVQDNLTSFSLRSVGNFDVSKIAKKFGGGGHKNAAGFVLQDATIESIQKLIGGR